MDGAWKFVKGDAIAGIIIVIINLVGGLAIGMLQQGMSISEAAQTFSLLTVGDDGVMYMSVGLVDLEDEDEPGMVDHPMFYCPFCGTELQTVEEVRAKTGGENGLDDEED